MKLFVDDIRNAPNESWNVSRTVLSAIRAIEQFEPEWISLDHDISHQVTVGGVSRPYPCEETFESVAHYIALKHMNRIHERACGSKKPDWSPKIILHTSNPVGQKKMETILLEGLIPFADINTVLSKAVNRLEMEL